jgi:hypothetical protein
MLGALGKMNWTSSNLLRRRQFSARKILRTVSVCALRQKVRRVPASPAIAQAMGDNDGSCVPLEGRNDQGLGHAETRAVEFECGVGRIAG